MSEWQTPTDRAATSTSSSAISGTGSSSTSGAPRPANRSAFMCFSFWVISCARTRTLTWSPVGDSSVSKPFSTMSAIVDLRADHLLHRQPPLRDQVDDPRPVGDRVAPGAGQRDVALGEHHRVDRRRPACAARSARCGRPSGPAASAVCSARSLPEHSMTASTPMPPVRSFSPAPRRRPGRVEHLADVEARASAARRSG